MWVILKLLGQIIVAISIIFFVETNVFIFLIIWLIGWSIYDLHYKFKKRAVDTLSELLCPNCKEDINI